MSGSLFIISAPSGAGKSSLLARVIQHLPNAQLSISHTTRAKRSGEVDGENYFFVDELTFSSMQKQNDFLESAQVFQHHYGTSKSKVLEALAHGTDVILEIDWQGAEQVRSVIPNAISVFIFPPSFTTLKQRLVDRNTDDESTIALRLTEAFEDITHYCNYDFIVINDDFETAATELSAILRTPSLKTQNQQATIQAILDDFTH